jgi:hypothetical protein
VQLFPDPDPNSSFLLKSYGSVTAYNQEGGGAVDGFSLLVVSFLSIRWVEGCNRMPCFGLYISAPSRLTKKCFVCEMKFVCVVISKLQAAILAMLYQKCWQPQLSVWSVSSSRSVQNMGGVVYGSPCISPSDASHSHLLAYLSFPNLSICVARYSKTLFTATSSGYRVTIQGAPELPHPR